MTQPTVTPLLREALGAVLREIRLRRDLTLREVSASSMVSLGYLSEVERGQKECSSEVLAAICEALDVEASDVIAAAATRMQRRGTLKLAA